MLRRPRTASFGIGCGSLLTEPLDTPLVKKALQRLPSIGPVEAFPECHSVPGLSRFGRRSMLSHLRGSHAPSISCARNLGASGAGSKRRRPHPSSGRDPGPFRPGHRGHRSSFGYRPAPGAGSSATSARTVSCDLPGRQHEERHCIDRAEERHAYAAREEDLDRSSGLSDRQFDLNERIGRAPFPEILPTPGAYTPRVSR